MTAHLFGKIDSPFCPNFAIGKHVLDKTDIIDPLVVTLVDKDFYMDDSLKSHSSIEYLANVTY